LLILLSVGGRRIGCSTIRGASSLGQRPGNSVPSSWREFERETSTLRVRHFWKRFPNARRAHRQRPYRETAVAEVEIPRQNPARFAGILHSSFVENRFAGSCVRA